MVDKARAGGSGASGEARQTWGLLQSGRLGSVALPPFSSGPHLTPPCRPQLVVAHLNTEPGTSERMDELEKYTAVVEGQLEACGAKIDFAKQVEEVGGGGVWRGGPRNYVVRGEDGGCASTALSLV